MIRTEATHLADTISRIWPRGAITLDIWTEVLEEMYYAPAAETVRKLRDTADTMPSIAAFKTTYNGLLGTAREHIDCPKCGGDGWVSVKPYIVNGREYDGVKPCTCRNGEATRDVHKRILDLNAAELAPHARRNDEDAVGPPAFTRRSA